MPGKLAFHQSGGNFGQLAEDRFTRLLMKRFQFISCIYSKCTRLVCDY